MSCEEGGPSIPVAIANYRSLHIQNLRRIRALDMPERGDQEYAESSPCGGVQRKRSAETAGLPDAASTPQRATDGTDVSVRDATGAQAVLTEEQAGSESNGRPRTVDENGVNPGGMDSGWQQARYPTTGALYYFNSRLQESRWDPPPEGYTPLHREHHAAQLHSERTGGAVPDASTTSSAVRADVTVGWQGWYYLDFYGNQQGPFSKEQLQGWWDAQQLNPHTRLWRSEDPSRAWQIALGELVQQWEDSDGRRGDPASRSAPATEGSAASGSGYSDYAAAALAGLPENDDAVKIAKLAAATGQSMEDMLQFSYRSAANGSGKAPVVRAVHNPRTGRIEQEVVEGTESTYAGMESWLDSSKLEEQLQAMKARIEVKLPGEFWMLLRARKQETKLKVKRKDMAWLYQ